MTSTISSDHPQRYIDEEGNERYKRTRQSWGRLTGTKGPHKRKSMESIKKLAPNLGIAKRSNIYGPAFKGLCKDIGCIHANKNGDFNYRACMKEVDDIDVNIKHVVDRSHIEVGGKTFRLLNISEFHVLFLAIGNFLKINSKENKKFKLFRKVGKNKHALIQKLYDVPYIEDHQKYQELNDEDENWKLVNSKKEKVAYWVKIGDTLVEILIDTQTELDKKKKYQIEFSRILGLKIEKSMCLFELCELNALHLAMSDFLIHNIDQSGDLVSIFRRYVHENGELSDIEIVSEVSRQGFDNSDYDEVDEASNTTAMDVDGVQSKISSGLQFSGHRDHDVSSQGSSHSSDSESA